MTEDEILRKERLQIEGAFIIDDSGQQQPELVCRPCGNVELVVSAAIVKDLQGLVLFASCPQCDTIYRVRAVVQEIVEARHVQ